LFVFGGCESWSQGADMLARSPEYLAAVRFALSKDRPSHLILADVSQLFNHDLA
jgi:hypothetical protein